MVFLCGLFFAFSACGRGGSDNQPTFNFNEQNVQDYDAPNGVVPPAGVLPGAPTVPPPIEDYTHPRSRLTGLPQPPEIIERRPFAVVFNNIHRALPQSGIGSADVLYEVLAEADVTRILGIFQSYIPEMLGPVRSMRQYLVDLAFNHDAIIVNHGSSPGGGTRMWDLSAERIDGNQLERFGVFWRNRNYPVWYERNTGLRPMEHSSFTGEERLFQHMELAGMRYYFNENLRYGFDFSVSGGLPSGTVVNPAMRITIPFSHAYTRFFNFCSDTELYFVENIHGRHMDALTREQVSVRNILVQFTPMNIIPGDVEGRRNVQTVGEGEGLLFSGGVYTPVRWARDDHATPTRWYFANGEPLRLAPGRTWINIFQGEVTIE